MQLIRTKVATMGLTIKSISDFFNLKPFQFLKPQESPAFIVAVLYDHDSYGTELANIIEQNDHLGISDTILYLGLDFLIDSNLIIAYNKPIDPDVKGTKGRPPTYYRLNLTTKNQSVIRQLKGFWETKYPNVSLRLESDTNPK